MRGHSRIGRIHVTVAVSLLACLPMPPCVVAQAHNRFTSAVHAHYVAHTHTHTLHIRTQAPQDRWALGVVAKQWCQAVDVCVEQSFVAVSAAEDLVVVQPESVRRAVV